MSLYNAEIRDAIVTYLKSEFPTFNAQEQQEEDSYCFRLTNESTGSYFVRVMFSVTQGINEEQMNTLLEQYAVAATMRSLGDFPVVVTEQGCMFGSP